MRVVRAGLALCVLAVAMHPAAVLVHAGVVLLALLQADQVVASEDAVLDAFNYVVGTQTFSPSYQFTSEPKLVETARAILAMGSTTLKFSLKPQEESAQKVRTR